MVKVDVRTAAGDTAGSVELDAGMFSVEPNVPVMHQVVTAQLAARRAGTQSTLTRREVRGGGAKPWKQKGTGRARAGSSAMPNWRGGGVALGPKPREYSQRTPKKMKRLALRSALSDRAADGKVMVIDSWSFEAPRTKDAVAALRALGLEGNVLVVVDADDQNAWMSFRNLSNVHVVSPGELNTYDVLVSDTVIFTKDNLPTAPAKAPKRPKTEASGDAGEADAGSGFDAEASGEYGPGSAAPLEGGEAPSDEYVVKGNAGSMLYHPPESPFFGRTVADVWFTSAEAAEAAGFSLPASMQKAGTDSAPNGDDDGEES